MCVRSPCLSLKLGIWEPISAWRPLPLTALAAVHTGARLVQIQPAFTGSRLPLPRTPDEIPELRDSQAGGFGSESRHSSYCSTPLPCL